MIDYAQLLAKALSGVRNADKSSNAARSIGVTNNNRVVTGASLYSQDMEVREKLSSLKDNGSYPFIVFPISFSSFFDSPVNSDSLLEYCLLTKGDLPCLKSLKEPLKPQEPHLSDIPTSHYVLVKEPFWKSGPIMIWLISSVLFGGLPGYYMADPLFERLLYALLGFLSWAMVSLFIFGRDGLSRSDIYKEVLYTKEELKDLALQEKNRFDMAMEEYSQALHQYEEDLKYYKKAMKKRKSIMRLSIPAYLSWRLRSSFSQSNDYSVTDDPPKKGRSEDTLFSCLMRSIPSKVHIDTVVSGYYPDIMVATNNNVFIDIEIDEPYEMDSKKEIHYIGCEDATRDSRIANRNWIVLRFSEKQIMTDCTACSILIENLIKMVEEGSLKALDEILSIRASIEDDRWRKEDARMMAINNYRKSY